MGDILRIKISRSVKILILLSLHEWNIFAFAPRGCTYKDGTASCDFQQWAPPLQDKDFGPSPLHRLSLNKIHGNILAGVMFSVLCFCFILVLFYSVLGFDGMLGC